MFCPVCKAEYRQGFTRCADCEVDLTGTLQEEPKEAIAAEWPEDDSLVRLWRGADPVVYTALVNALREAQVPFYDLQPRDYENQLSAIYPMPIDLGIPNFDIRVPRSDSAAAEWVRDSVLEQTYRQAEIGEEVLQLEETANRGETNLPEGEPQTAVVEVWKGNDVALAEFLVATLLENGISSHQQQIGEAGCGVFVHPRHELQAQKIVCEVLESKPQE